MNALAKALAPQSPDVSGTLRLSKAMVASKHHGQVAVAHGTVDARHVVLGSQHIDEQFLIVGNSSWSAQNVDRVLGSAINPSREEAEATALAMKRLDSRAGENVSEWAKNLAKTLSTYND